MSAGEAAATVLECEQNAERLAIRRANGLELLVQQKKSAKSGA